MNEWEDFERAVAAFVKALTPGARVTHNAQLPDKHTGHIRQRDVWIEANVGPFPITILVSCKRLKRKINEQDIDAFVGELGSSGAHKGVLYSMSGYSRPAIEKALALSISCCKLYQNEPAELPIVLQFSFLCCTGAFTIQFNPEALDEWGDATVDELLSLPQQADGGAGSVLDHLMTEAACQTRTAIQEAMNRVRIPEVCICGVRIGTDDDGVTPLDLGVRVIWRVYRARFEAQILNGSYFFTEGTFRGRQAAPIVDLRAPPGPGWELLDKPPSELGPGTALIVLEHDDFGQQLLMEFGPKTLRELFATAQGCD